MDRSPQHLARNVTRLSHLDLPGAGQVYVAGDYAYVGHIPNKKQLGTSILDVRDPKNPKVVSQISLDDPDSHSHKARVIGDLMIVNSERNMTPIGRRAEELPRLRARLRESLKREPSSRRARGEARHQGIRHSHGRGGRAQSLRPGRLPHLRRQGPNPAQAPRLPEDRRDRGAPLRHGRALRLHLDRDGRLRRQHPRHLRHPQSDQARRSLALVDAGTTPRRQEKSPPGQASATACTTRCASATNSGPAAGTRACA